MRENQHFRNTQDIKIWSEFFYCFMFVGLVKLIAWVWIQLNKLFYFFIHKDQQPFNLQDSGAPYNVEDHLWKKKTPQTLWCNCRVTQNGWHFRDNYKQYRINYCLSFYIYSRYCSILLDARYSKSLNESL